jgi:DNA polymerase (family 10)
MKNQEICAIFRDIAKILEIKGGNPFRIRAYERAAQNIEGLTENIEIYIRNDTLTEIPGIGIDLAERIKEFARFGKIKIYEDLKKSIPAGLLDLLKVPSIGPKTAKLLYDELKIKNIRGLERAIKAKKLTGIFGIKEKTIENISKGIELFKRGRERMSLAQAIQTADEFIGALEKMPEVKKISCAGSLRRRKETVRDIDILMVSKKPKSVMEAFVKLAAVKEALVKGETKSSVRTSLDVQVDCRIVEEKSYGAALLYFTGSKNFNIKIRQLAIRKGLKVNEYGISRKDKFIAGKSEEEMFKALGMPYIEPELREDTGEIELALKSRLPRLIELKNIKGDLHVHSKWSDGSNSIEEVALACQKKGYSYVAVTDHSQSLKIARGLSIPDLKRKRKEIDKVNKKLKSLRVLFGAEVDIDSQGKIDYPDEVLKDFDLVVAAIHTGFKQSKEQLTRRIIGACNNRYVNIIAHPTGRLRGVRDPYDIDLERILRAARDTNTYLEINSFPDRLDLNDLNCHRAKETGVRLSIDTDSHAVEQLAAMSLGVSVARRGWLSSSDVINTLSCEELLKTIRK